MSVYCCWSIPLVEALLIIPLCWCFPSQTCPGDGIFQLQQLQDLEPAEWRQKLRGTWRCFFWKQQLFIWLVVSNMNVIFHDIWDNPSHWLIFFRGVETTNQSWTSWNTQWNMKVDTIILWRFMEYSVFFLILGILLKKNYESTIAFIMEYHARFILVEYWVAIKTTYSHFIFTQ